MIAIVAIVALAALLAYREYVHAQERSQYIAERAAVEKTHSAERAELAQRIQAPKMAIVEHAMDRAEPPASLPFDDDASFWKAREERNYG